MEERMEEAKALAQQQLMLQQQQQRQQQQQQQLLLFQQLQQQQKQQQQQQQSAAAAAISRFPSNIDAHLRPPGQFQHRSSSVNNPQPPPPPPQQQQSPNPNPNPNSNSIISNLQQQQQQQQQQQHQNQNPTSSNPQMQQQQKAIAAVNQAELQMAYQDAWRVCHPDFKRPFSSLEDACDRLLPYHVVADYEAEEDDRILDSDTTGQMLSRSQQWDHNIAAKVAEFTATFEKQALAFNIISRKRALGEFRSEERLMIEQALLQEERRAMFELRAEMESREKAGREAHEAKLRMAAAMVKAEQTRAAESHAEIMARAPIRASALGSQGSGDLAIGHDMLGGEQEQQGVNNPNDEMINGWGGNNALRDEKEPSEDFLNDEETENGETSSMQHEWRDVGEFDLNTR